MKLTLDGLGQFIDLAERMDATRRTLDDRRHQLQLGNPDEIVLEENAEGVFVPVKKVSQYDRARELLKEARKLQRRYPR